MKVKISGTAMKSLKLDGIEVTSQKDVARGKGTVVEIETTEIGARDILTRLEASSKNKEAVPSYDVRYAMGADAKRLAKLLNVAPAAPEAASPSTPAAEAAAAPAAQA